jgi:hypothetical protein
LAVYKSNKASANGQSVDSQILDAAARAAPRTIRLLSGNDADAVGSEQALFQRNINGSLRAVMSVA